MTQDDSGRLSNDYKITKYKMTLYKFLISSLLGTPFSLLTTVININDSKFSLYSYIDKWVGMYFTLYIVLSLH